ncbi:MAG TPA: LuxR C-terminal-related transcriptional regulator [Dongiaceae bacterium]|nr:LuxR C-terminal-related transcriptional regulator [Dongiaceae bacterium]
MLALVVSGLLNKQIGGELGISEITVKAHRGQVMHKMKADLSPPWLKCPPGFAVHEHGRLILRPPSSARSAGNF